ncbi:MAG: hypothetical protein ACP5PM_10145 [Acidimicrobiales bacterium]
MAVVGLVAWLVASSGATADHTSNPAANATANHTSNPAASPRAGAATGAATGQEPASSGAGPTDRNPSSPSVVASLAPWHLPSALSRAGAAALPGGRALLLGGLFASGASSSDVGVLDLETGALTSVATLASPTHDAGSAVLGRRALLFGGGQAYPVATVEAVTLPSGSPTGSSSGSPTGSSGSTPGSSPTSTPGAGAAGVVTGQLPQPRADDEAVSVTGTAYVVGGYDGSTGDTAVLATQDGSSFTTVATLPVDVRYAAVTAAGGTIYVFGGETAPGGATLEYTTPSPTTSPPPGQQVALVQEIDPAAHTARVAGYLPRGVQGAAAFDLGGTLLLAGGDSNAPGTPPSSGSTIWSFDPATGAFHLVGHLAVPVAYAAVVVEGSTAWLIGGEHDGVPVSTVQKVVLRSSS